MFLICINCTEMFAHVSKSNLYMYYKTEVEYSCINVEDQFALNSQILLVANRTLS